VNDCLRMDHKVTTRAEIGRTENNIPRSTGSAEKVQDMGTETIDHLTKVPNERYLTVCSIRFAVGLYGSPGASYSIEQYPLYLCCFKIANVRAKIHVCGFALLVDFAVLHMARCHTRARTWRRLRVSIVVVTRIQGIAKVRQRVQPRACSPYR